MAVRYTGENKPDLPPTDCMPPPPPPFTPVTSLTPVDDVVNDFAGTVLRADVSNNCNDLHALSSHSVSLSVAAAAQRRQSRLRAARDQHAVRR